MEKSTKIIHSGRNPSKYSGNINTPIYQTSTISFDSLAELDQANIAYGRHGTDTVFELAKLVSEIENAHETFFLPCGLSAITMAMLSFLENGDHILITDSSYEPTKNFVEKFLNRFGVSHSYYKSGDLDSLKASYQDNTKLIWLESPGSTFFALDDLDGLLRFAKEKSLVSMVDNTWASGRLLRPLDLGFDISVQSCSKYLCGHSDAMLGSVSVANEKISNKILQTYKLLGSRVSPNDCFLISRGIRTLDVRLKEQGKSGLEVAKFLESHELVAKVYHLPLESHRHHQRWKKYYSGGNGLVSFNFVEKVSIDSIRQFVDDLELFGIGYSWGGFESLIMLYTNLKGVDLTENYNHIIRISVGMEDVSDLISDLESALSNI